jgi:hypothetical protein
MGDISIAQDILEGVTDALADLGNTKKTRTVSVGPLVPGNPGAGGTQTVTDTDVEAIISDYDERYVDGSTVREGDRQAILSIGPLSAAQIAAIKPGARLVDGAQVYSVVRTKLPEVAGTPVVAILQLRGSNG